MLEAPFSLDDIMAPIGAERFLKEYEGKKPLHLKGAADKFAAVMNWARLSDLLGQSTIWSHQSLMLVLDKEQISAPQYCTQVVGRDGGQVLRPDPDKVQSYLRKGATLVANDIDHLSTGLTSFSKAMEEALGGKVQGNLYCSSKRRQGFAAHFDTHDVYAVHVEGTKTWHIYEGRANDPIAHPMFKTMGRDHHEKAKGALLMDVKMEPGDLLYLPRGQYHDALADEGGAVHIAFGLTYPIGIDVMSYLFDRVIARDAFRTNLPRPNGRDNEALKMRLGELADEIRTVLSEPKTANDIARLQTEFSYPRHHYDMEALLRTAENPSYKVHNDKIRLVEQGGRYGLVEQGSHHAIEVPGDLSDMVDWVLKRQQFSRNELQNAFPTCKNTKLDKLLDDLGSMKLTKPL